MTTLADELASLSPEERQLLELTLREKGIEITKYQIPPRAQSAEYYPTSFSQKRLWFVSQLAPENPNYHITNPLRLGGVLATEALARALNTVVERHEALRTTFASRDGQPVQRVEPFLARPLPIVDLSRLAAARGESVAREIADGLFRQPFDLESGPLIRWALVRISPVSHAFLLTVHHIVFDGVSLGIFLHELLTLYDVYRRGAGDSLAPLPIQYADYALWQHQHLGGGQGELEDYWRSQLAGLPDDLELPFDRPRPLTMGGRGGASLPITFSPAQSEALSALARGQRSTLYVVTLAAFHAMLYRFTGQVDLVVGSPVAGRNRKEIEGLIGFFVNTLLLRGDLSGRPTFEQLVDRLSEVHAGALSHQDMPFEWLVELLQPERSLNRMPLYQVAFSFQQEPGGNLGGPSGLELTHQEQDRPVTLLDFTMVLTDSPRGLFGSLVFDTALFDTATVWRMRDGYLRWLDAAVGDPSRVVDDLPVTSAAESHQVLVEWSPAPWADPAPEKLLHRLVEAQVTSTPDAPAVFCDDVELSYRELDERANRVAHYLVSLGVEPEVMVGLLLEPSVDQVVAMLGVLKTGGAYLPMDPSTPTDRLLVMLDDAQRDSGPRVTLVDSDQLGDREQLVRMDGPEIASLPATPLVARGSESNIAYVIYTSGSTGKPKGVAVAHRVIAERIWSQGSTETEGRPGDSCLSRTSISFDISLVEIFTPLIAGARVVIPRPGGRQDLDYLDGLIRGQKLTHIALSPPMLDQAVQRGLPARWSSVKRMLTGGETLPAELPARFNEQLDVPLFNRYGPTEATVSMLTWRCLPGDRSWRLPLGFPIGRSRIHVLSRDFRPLPIQVAGELVIGGVCLARGYLHRPRRTSAVFTPDPFAEIKGERLYRTGDLGCQRADGAVEFLGRIDRQVKVRGFRVKLGEIEAALRQLDTVAAVAVTSYKDASDAVALAAYVQAADPAVALDTAALKADLERRLPAYMVPASFTVLDQVPFLASGKVDRRALPTPDPRGGGKTGSAGVKPRNQVELEIAEVWREVLQLETVGVHENFFDLGGHSLLLVQMQTQLEKLHGYKVAMIDLFRYSTIADLGNFPAAGVGRFPSRFGH